MKCIFNLFFFCFSTRFYTVDAWVNSYVETIYLVGNEDDWEVPDKIKQRKVLKLPFQMKSGRPKTHRRPPQGEKKKALCHYSSCGGQGHNRSTYKYIMPTPSIVNGLDRKSATQQVQTHRRPPLGEKKKALCHYSSCGGQGHNRSTYKYIMPTPSIVSGSDRISATQ